MITMEAFDAYKIYMALKAHFNSDYDFNKYGGKTTVTKQSYLKRKDKFFFGRVARKYKEQVKDFFISNFLVKEKGYIGSFNEDNYLSWRKRVESLRYNFQQDMDILVNQVNDFNSLFKLSFVLDNIKINGQHPILLRNYLANRISVETMVILMSLLEFDKDWDKKIQENVIWPSHKKRLNNYGGLLTFDKSYYKMILINLINGVYYDTNKRISD